MRGERGQPIPGSRHGEAQSVSRVYTDSNSTTGSSGFRVGCRPDHGRCGTNPNTGQQGRERARVLLEVGRWREAIGHLAEVLRSHPDDVAALCLLARCHELAGDPAQALATARRALAVAPDNEWALRLEALALIGLKRRRAALRSARAAVAAAPGEWRTHAALVAVLVHQPGIRSLVAARLAADTVLRLAPEEPDAHLVDAQVCLRTGELAAARRGCERALQRDPGHQAARHTLALVELTGDRVASAARGFSAALALAPDDGVTGRAHSAGARALLWRLFDVLAVATALHLAVFAAAAGPLGAGRRPLGLAVAGSILVGFGVLCVRSWRRQPAAVRWRLRAERRDAAVALWPVAVAAAATALVLGAWQPPDGTAAADLAGVCLTATVLVGGLRLGRLLARWALVVVSRLAYRAALGLHRAGARLRRRAADPGIGAGG
nr:tetratricopeptide repeat protein [Micromonospora sp. HK10]